MKIINTETLGGSPLRVKALRIIEAGLEAIDTEHVMQRMVRYEGTSLSVGEKTFTVQKEGRVFVITIGKCAVPAAEALEKVLGERISGGIALDIKPGESLRYIRGMQGTHPMPSEQNMAGAQAIVDMLAHLTEKDFVLFVISGGGSTLLCLPDGGSCIEEEMVLKTLMRAGATIQEINTVRKHLSLARGGHLAQYAYPAEVVSLILSDVPGDDIGFVASGPTVKDDTTISDAEAILAKYEVMRICRIEKCGLVETPKDEKYFARVTNILAVSNATALHAMGEEAMRLGLKTEMRGRALVGEASTVAQNLVGELHSIPSGTVLLYGGETTVTLTGHGGKGGRNLEFSLAALPSIREGELIISVASDGRDNGPFAGAICDTITKEAAHTLHADVEGTLARHDEYPFYERVGSYLLTGDTGSNVSDLVIAIKE